MKIFIIGGTGFISSRVVENLLQTGHQVTVFTRGMSKNLHRKNKHLTFRIGDRNKRSDLQKAIGRNNFDAVYDFAAYYPSQSQICIDLLKGKLDRFIHCSTVSVYMVSRDVQCPITEDQDRRPLMEHWPRNPFGMDYGIDKRKCEEILWQHYDEKKFAVSMLRPTFVSGPADPARRDFFWIERIMDGRPLLVPGTGDFAFQQVYVEDAARAFVSLLEKSTSIGKAYNVAAEQVFTLNEYLQKLSGLLHRSPEMMHIDQEVFDQLPFSSHLQGDVFPFNTRRPAVFSLAQIKKDLDFKATPFSEWMPKTIEWFTRPAAGHSVGYENRELEIQFALKHRK